MNSAQLPSFSTIPIDSSGWDAVRRIYRQVCVLRALGRESDASALERSDLSPALVTARAAAPADVSEDVLFAQESERVSSAALFADVLAPLLADRLHSAERTTPAPVAAASPALSSVKPVAPTPVPSRSSSAAVPGIADLIDGMLSQQRAFAATPTPS